MFANSKGLIAALMLVSLGKVARAECEGGGQWYFVLGDYDRFTHLGIITRKMMRFPSSAKASLLTSVSFPNIGFLTALGLGCR